MFIARPHTNSIRSPSLATTSAGGVRSLLPDSEASSAQRKEIGGAARGSDEVSRTERQVVDRPHDRENGTPAAHTGAGEGDGKEHVKHEYKKEWWVDGEQKITGGEVKARTMKKGYRETTKEESSQERLSICVCVCVSVLVFQVWS